MPINATAADCFQAIQDLKKTNCQESRVRKEIKRLETQVKLKRASEKNLEEFKIKTNALQQVAASVGNEREQKMVKDMTEYIEKQNKKHLKKFRTV